MDDKAFGNRLKEARKAKNLTVEQLAEMMNRSPNSITQLEGGKRGTTLPTLVEFCHALDVSPTALLAADLKENLDDNSSEYIEVFEFFETLTPQELAVIKDITEITIEKRKSYREGKS